jgi:hypothetical protein
MGSLFWVNAVDTRTSAGGGNGWLDQHFSQPFAVKTMECSSICILHQCKYLGDNFSLEFKVL